MPKCKYCNVELEFDDTVDEYADDEMVSLTENGHCPQCNKEYQWYDIYKFDKYENVEEI